MLFTRILAHRNRVQSLRDGVDDPARIGWPTQLGRAEHGRAKGPGQSGLNQPVDRSLTQRLWLNRVTSALKLPVWVGILVVGILPISAFWFLANQIQIAVDFSSGAPIVVVPLLALNVAFLLGGTQLMRRRLTKLEEYTKTLGVDLREAELKRLVDLRFIAFVWVALLAVTSLILDPYAYGLQYLPFQSAMRLLLTGYMRFIQATFLWMFVYSMLTIYRWGKLPLRLNVFVEDQTLGLSVYGRASLFLVTLYVLAVFITFPASLSLSQGDIIAESLFFLLGGGIFLAPLLGLRQKLLAAKNEELTWIQARHRRVIEEIRSCGDGPIEASLVNELNAVDSISSGIRRMSTWPFNSEILAKLLTVVLLPMSVVILTTYLIHILNL